MNVIKSCGGIVYYIDKKTRQPKFLLIKRYALSKKIEWVAPKGKIDPGETPEQTAVRETYEEAGLHQDKQSLIAKVGEIDLSLRDEQKGSLDKNISYFLIEYKGSPRDVKIIDGEGYLGYYKWASMQEISGLIYYENLREIYRKAYNMVLNKKTGK